MNPKKKLRKKDERERWLWTPGSALIEALRIAENIRWQDAAQYTEHEQAIMALYFELRTWENRVHELEREIGRLTKLACDRLASRDLLAERH